MGRSLSCTQVVFDASVLDLSTGTTEACWKCLLWHKKTLDEASRQQTSPPAVIGLKIKTLLVDQFPEDLEQLIPAP